MKRIIAIVTALVLMLSVFAVGVSAVSKADLLTEAAKSPIYKYVKVAVENASRTVEITDDEAEKLLPIVQKMVTAVGDKGHGGFYSAEDGQMYTLAEYNEVMGCIDEACAVLGFTYKFVPSSNPKHEGDSVFMVYDEAGKLVFQYDGDLVADTDAASSVDTVALFAAASVILVAGVAVAVVAKKRIAVR